MSNKTVQFSATLSSTQNSTIRRGKIFDIRAFRDRGLTVSPSDVRNACANFQPVPLDIGHRESIFDNKLGKLQSVEYDEATGEIHGVVVEESWLSEVLGDAARRCSITWNIIGKKITGLAYTLSPHVADAALFSAFFAATETTKTDIEKIVDGISNRDSAYIIAKLKGEEPPDAGVVDMAEVLRAREQFAKLPRY